MFGIQLIQCLRLPLWLPPSGAFVFIALSLCVIHLLSAVCLLEVFKACLKIDRISRRTQRRLGFLPGSPEASGEEGVGRGGSGRGSRPFDM